MRYRIKLVPNSTPNVEGRWIEVEKETEAPTGRFLAVVEFFRREIPPGEHLVQYRPA